MRIGFVPRFILSVIPLLWAISANAQNWKPVLTDKTQYFISPDDIGPDSIIFGFQTHFSQAIGGDSIFRFNRITRKGYPGMTPLSVFCPPDTIAISYFPNLYYVFDQHNIAGDGMIAKPSGEFWFTGPNQDTFLIKTRVPIGTRWAYRPNSSDSATMVSKSVGLVLGALDSVLTIHLDNGSIYQFSKNHGVVSWPFFYPLVARSGAVEMWKGDLFGIPELGLGRKVPGYAEFYDFSVGDKIKLYQNKFAPNGGSANQSDHWEIDGPPSSGIPFAYNAKHRIYHGNTLYQENLFDVLQCPNLPVFSRLPGEFPMNRANIKDEVFLCYYKVKSAFNGRITAVYLNPQVVDTCYKYGARNSSIGWDGGMEMGEGIGMISWDYHNWAYNTEDWNYIDLLCYEKANEIWNGPCIPGIVGVDDPNSEGSFSLYPNPANQSVLVKLAAEMRMPYKVSFSDMQGSKLFETETIDPQVSLPTDHLPAGIYLISVEGVKGARSVRKLVIGH